MAKIFTTELSDTIKNKNVLVHELLYSKSCNQTNMSFPEISYQFKKSPFGKVLILKNEIGLCLSLIHI